MMINRKLTPCLAMFILVLCQPLYCQTTAFTYQGSLSNAGNPASGNHDLELALFDAVAGGTQLGTTQTLTNVPVTNGVFSVQVDFGNNFPGSNRFLEVRVRPSGGGGFTTLSPRQAITSSPYSIKSLAADNAASAVNSQQLGGSPASEFIVTTDPRLTDARNPLPGSANYVQNTAVQQAGGNFNISGTGTADTFNAATQYNLAGTRILSNAGTNNLFAGVSSGAANTSGLANAFFGTFAGQGTTSGSTNAFFGSSAGFSNTVGNENSFIGASAGSQNTSGSLNTFAGSFAGFGNMTGSSNSFFGRNAGVNNTTGFNNSFYGTSSGSMNTTGSNNTLLGHSTNFEIGNLTFATAIGAGTTVGSNNTIVLGRSGGQDLVHIPGNAIVSGDLTSSQLGAPIISANTQFNIGTSRILANPGTNNLFAGVGAGANSTGINNAFFGFGAGTFTTTTSGNSFFGSRAGLNQTGASNSFFGERSGQNTTGSENSFFGASAGLNNLNGERNTFFGSQAGRNTQTGSDNVFIGPLAGINNVSGSNNSIIGASASLANGLTNAAAIGWRAFVTQSNSISLGGINGTNGATADTNVGIGTPAPSEKLHLTANSGNVVIGNPGCNAGFAAIGFGASFGVCSNYSVMGNGTDTMVNRPAGGRIFLRENNANQMTIAAGGNVGIGTISPEKKLHVLGPSSVEVQIESSDAGGRKWTLQSSSGGSNGRFEIIDRTANASRMTILDDGNVGVGTVAPADKLHVNGILRLNTLGAAGVTHLCRNASNQISTCSSPRSYGNGEGENDDSVGAVLLNAVKEQQAQIERQERMINALKLALCAAQPTSAICSEETK